MWFETLIIKRGCEISTELEKNVKMKIICGSKLWKFIDHLTSVKRNEKLNDWITIMKSYWSIIITDFDLKLQNWTMTSIYILCKWNLSLIDLRTLSSRLPMKRSVKSKPNGDFIANRFGLLFNSLSKQAGPFFHFQLMSACISGYQQAWWGKEDNLILHILVCVEWLLHHQVELIFDRRKKLVLSIFSS